jgi:hypothetical protein
VVGIGYTSSIQKAIEVIMMLIKDDERILFDSRRDKSLMEGGEFAQCVPSD